MSDPTNVPGDEPMFPLPKMQHSDDRHDDNSRDRLNTIADGYVVWSKRTFRILLGIALLLIVLTVVTVYLLDQNAERSKENKQSQQEFAKAVVTKDLRDCIDRNTRHDAAINALKEGSDVDIKNAPTETIKKEIARRRDVTISLIDAIAPRRNCVEEAKKIGFKEGASG